MSFSLISVDHTWALLESLLVYVKLEVDYEESYNIFVPIRYIQILIP